MICSEFFPYYAHVTDSQVKKKTKPWMSYYMIWRYVLLWQILYLSRFFSYPSGLRAPLSTYRISFLRAYKKLQYHFCNLQRLVQGFKKSGWRFAVSFVMKWQYIQTRNVLEFLKLSTGLFFSRYKWNLQMLFKILIYNGHTSERWQNVAPRGESNQWAVHIELIDLFVLIGKPF